VSAHAFARAFGGKGSNQAVAARRAGAEATGVFNLGGDDHGRELLEVWRREGLDVSLVRMDAAESTGLAMILVDAAGDNLIAVFPGANGTMTPEQAESAGAAMAEAGLVLLQMEIPDAVNRRAIELAATAGVEVMLNYAPARASSLALDSRVGILAVNETEAGILAGMAVSSPAEAETAAAKLGENGHRLVVVTLGDKGCSVWERGGGVRSYPAFPIPAVDATAAGDSFCGALGAALIEKMPLEPAVRFASAAGAVSASRPGALPSLPHRREIEEFLAKSAQST
jgi:ribokinase